MFVSQLIRGRISELQTQCRDAVLSQLEQDKLEDHSADDLTLNTLDMHHHTSAPQAPTTFKAVEAVHLSDQAFRSFCRNLAIFIKNFFLAQGIPLGPIQPAAHKKVSYIFD
jgi:hypothetical protein